MTGAHGGAAITIFCLMRPKPGAAAELRQGLVTLVAPTRAEADCLTYDLYEEADGSLVLFETWRSTAELEAHQQQPAVRQFFDDQMPALLDGDMGVHVSTLLSPASAASASPHYS